MTQLLDYQEFLKSKVFEGTNNGFHIDANKIHPKLFDFQRDIVQWAIKKGKAAIFADVGLGKTIMMCEWSRQIDKHTLIVAPLSVAQQTVAEAKKLLDMDIQYVRSQKQIDFDTCKYYITNYEMVDKFDESLFDAVILDESSILKNQTGKYRNMLIEKFRHTKYKLCCTATPSPNDIKELGNHAEFLNVMTLPQMLSMFFVHDSHIRNGAWRLKKHATEKFYQWLATWAVAIRKPSDIGYDDGKFIKPKIETIVKTVETESTPDGMLPGFFAQAVSASEAKALRRTTVDDRSELTAKLVNDSKEQFIIWCGLNNEAETLESMIPDSVNVHGSMSIDDKIDYIQKFTSGELRVLITKTSIAGMGVNMQNCHNMIFFGIDYSWESYYQAVGRIWRFGQQSDTVYVYVVTSTQEMNIFKSVMDKQESSYQMQEGLIEQMSINSEIKKEPTHNDFQYETKTATGDDWRFILGDSCEVMPTILDESVDLSIYSPPFNDVFVYTNTERDIGNSKDLSEFFEHYKFIIKENLRITKQGRIACVHLQELRALKGTHGYRGLVDFTGMVIQAYVEAGWIWRSRITIDKNPQSLAIRTKDQDLLFVTMAKDSADSAPMNTDYLLVFKKPGDNEIPITPIENGDVTREKWIEWARAIWYDINETDVLNVRVAKADDDEKHMCPLQLPLIERCVKLWSNPNELVFSPFGGIASEGFEAIKNNRRFLGIELKPEYWEVGKQNLAYAVSQRSQKKLF